MADNEQLFPAGWQREWIDSGLCPPYASTVDNEGKSLGVFFSDKATLKAYIYQYGEDQPTIIIAESRQDADNILGRERGLMELDILEHSYDYKVEVKPLERGLLY